MHNKKFITVLSILALSGSIQMFSSDRAASAFEGTPEEREEFEQFRKKFREELRLRGPDSVGVRLENVDPEERDRRIRWLEEKTEQMQPASSSAAAAGSGLAAEPSRVSTIDKLIFKDADNPKDSLEKYERLRTKVLEKINEVSPDFLRNLSLYEGSRHSEMVEPNFKQDSKLAKDFLEDAIGLTTKDRMFVFKLLHKEFSQSKDLEE